MEMDQLQKQIVKFRDDRNWRQFHSLKDLIIGLGIEHAELSELFLWKSETEIAQIPKDKIENEIADIFIFLTYLTTHFNINLEKAITEKLAINEKKYPVDKSFGSNKKYNEL
jgi:NTP pyrophosphatase (non-canonical NTP hydrolase)